jgi:hypothetical protein
LHVYEYAKDTRTFFTGYKTASTAVNLTYTPPSSSSAAWTNPSNALTNNNSYADALFGANAYSDWLILSDYGFEIPEDSFIVGASVRLYQKHDTAGAGSTQVTFAFTDDGGTTIDGEEITGTVARSPTETLDVYGGADVFWGSTILIPSIVNTSDFGVGIRGFRGVIGGVTWEMDKVELGLHYKPLVSETTTELLSVGDNLFRQKEGTFEVSYSGGGTGAISVLPVESSGYQVDLLEGGSSISGWPKTYATGSSPGLLSTLKSDIDGEVNWSVAATPIARVNGDVIAGTSITVDSSPQTFSDGDRVGFTDSAKGHTVWRHIHEVSGTPSFELDVEATVDDNEWLGLGREPVSSLPITEQTNISSGSSLTLKVPYMEGVSNIVTTETFSTLQTFIGGLPGTQDSPFFDSSYSGNIGQRNFSLVNARDVAYMAVPFYKNRGINLTTFNGETLKGNTGLWKYDGLHCYGAGLPIPPDDFFSLTSGADTYRYAFQLSYKDFRGNIVDGPVFTPTSLQDGITAATGTPNTAFDWDHGLSASIWPNRFADISSGTGSSTNVLTVDEGHSLIPGITVLLYDDSTTSFVERLVTETTRTTITIDGDPIDYDTTGYTSADARRYISMLRLVIWRSEGDGSVLYFAGERPVGGSSGTTSFTDDTADGSLGENLISPDREPDPFPKLSFLTLHQGLIVGSGNPDSPESIYFADALFPEASPLASNNFNVLSGGKVTALGSDNDDMLAVFKERNYFNIVGDLDSLSFQVLEVAKGEYGCPGHHALVKTNNVLIFPAEVGFKAVSGGALVSDFEDRLVEDFSYNFYEQIPGTEIDSTDEDKLVYKRAVATFNPDTSEYICFVPAESGTPEANGTLVPNTNSQVFVYNFQKRSWYKWSLPLANNFAGGLVVYKGGLWGQSRILDTVVQGQVWKQKTDRNQYDYIDDVTAITKTLRMTWDSLDFPSSFFRAIFLKLYQFHPVEFLTSFGLTVNEYREYNETTKYTQATRTFSDTSDRQKRVKFKTGKASALSLEFVNDTAFEKSLLSGYEYSVAAPYRQEIRAGRGEG